MKFKIHLLLILFLMSFAGTFAQQVFLNPDPTNVTESGAFDLSIEVDAGVTGFRGFRFVFSYDDDLMDFVSAEKGSLFDGFYSYWWRVFDVSADSLHIECMIFGAGLSVDGPGSVLKMQFQTVGEGSSAFHFNDCKIYNEAGTIMPDIIATDGLVNINFTPMISVEGVITDLESALPLANIPVTISNGGGTVITDNNGFFSSQLPQGWTGSVTPQMTGYSFAPEFRSYNNLQSAVMDANFSRSSNPITISGYVIDNTGQRIHRAAVWFGDDYGTAWNFRNGYSKTVPAGSGGTITPVMTGYLFTPESRNWSNITSPLSAQNFVGQPTAQTFTISGTINDAETGTPLHNVKVKFSDGGGSTYTDISGFFSMEVPYAWSGYIKPTISTHIFTPRKKYHFNVKEDLSGQNFAAFPSYHIKGHINDEAINFPLAGMRVVFSNNGDTAICNAQGNYDHQVAKGWTGDATPMMPGYNSTPPIRHYDPVFHDCEDQGYCGWAFDGSVGFTVNSGECCTWASVHELCTCCCLGDLIVEPGGEATLRASTDLVLRPGFHAKEGSAFHAFIAPVAPPPVKASAGPLVNDEKEDISLINETLVYPNPFQSKVNFEFPVQKDNATITIEIFDMGGNRVAKKTEHIAFSGRYSTSLKGNNLSYGMYFYRINNGTQYFTGKIIKTH